MNKQTIRLVYKVKKRVQHNKNNINIAPELNSQDNKIT